MPDRGEIKIYLSATTPFGDKLILNRIHGEERLSGLYHYTLEFTSNDLNLSFDQAVGKELSVAIHIENSDKRFIHGIVTRFAQLGSGTTYLVELRPAFWKLSLTRDCRIFQNRSVPQIVKDILGEFRITDLRDGLKGTYPAREYCVQYNESAFHFLSRLMAEEGIFYFFEHFNNKHVLVLADSSDIHQACPGINQLACLPPGRTWVGPADLTHFYAEQHVGADQYIVHDFSFETPAAKLTVETPSGGHLPIFETAAGFSKSDYGETIAKRRMDSIELPTKTVFGESQCLSLAAGFKISVKDHPRNSINREYVISTLSLSATPAGYSNSFSAFASNLVFRPPLSAEKPILAGPQTAIVVGKEGEEIWTDKYGRVCVQFHWDRQGNRDEKSSCWIRVAQSMAGKGWGSIFIPRVGQEVVVNFLEGNPDRPLITGAVYNGEQLAPYELPAHAARSALKTRSTKEGGAGYHEIRFDDSKDKEELFFHSQKDMTWLTEDKEVGAIKGSRHWFIDKKAPDLSSEKATLDENLSDELVVKGNRGVSVQTAESKETHKNEGAYSHSVAKTFSLKVEGDTLTIEAVNNLILKGKTIAIETTGGDLTINAKANMSVAVTQNLSAKASGNITQEATGNHSSKGNNVTCEAQMNLTNKAGMNLSNKAGMNLINEAQMNLENKAQMKLSNSAQLQNESTSSLVAKIQGTIVQIN